MLKKQLEHNFLLIERKVIKEMDLENRLVQGKNFDQSKNIFPFGGLCGVPC